MDIPTHYVDADIDKSTMTVLPARVFGKGVEVTLKDDDRNDPLINDELSNKGLDLYDIKFEFGRVGEDSHIALVDEISGGNMRAFKDGEYIEPLKLEEMML